MIEAIIIISLIVLFIHACFGGGMILEPLRVIFYKLTVKVTILRKPLYSCVTCMTPWYGSAIGFLIYGIDSETIVAVGAASGLNFIISKIIDFD